MHDRAAHLRLLQSREEAVGQVGEVLQVQGLEGRAAVRQHFQTRAFQSAVIRKLQFLMMGKQQERCSIIQQTQRRPNRWSPVGVPRQRNRVREPETAGIEYIYLEAGHVAEHLGHDIVSNFVMLQVKMPVVAKGGSQVVWRTPLRT